jgi:hypothetical protein
MHIFIHSQFKIRRSFAIYLSLFISIAAIALLYIFFDIPISGVDTTNWNTYRNEEYGFDFKYPNKEGYIPVETKDQVCIQGSCIGYSRFDGTDDIHILNARALHNSQKYDIYYWRKFIFVDNVLANMYIFDISVEGGSYKSKEIFLSRNGILYTITNFNNDMLSTVRFRD